MRIARNYKVEINSPIDIVFKALTDDMEIVQWFANAGYKFDPKMVVK